MERFLTVPDPRLAVLRTAPRLFRAIRIRLTEPAGPAAPDLALRRETPVRRTAGGEK